jgi:rsbT co-antagonist protein RsbR
VLTIILWVVLIVSTAVLGTFVGARAWDYLPARWFAFVAAILISLRLFAELRSIAPTAGDALIPSGLTLLALVLMEVGLLGLFAALFTPTWFAGRRPFLWIMVPYIAIGLFAVIDLLFGIGLVFSGLVREAGEYTYERAMPVGMIVLVLFFVSWLPHLLLLGVAFVRFDRARIDIGILVAALIVTMITGSIRFIGELQALPITVALAFVVFRTRLLQPARIGVEAALQAMREVVLVTDDQNRIVYANPAAQQLSFQIGMPLAVMLPHESTQETIIDWQELRLAMLRTPLRDQAQRSIGALVLGRDVTELEDRTRLLEQERARLAEMVEHLRSEQSERAELAATVQTLSLPVIPVLPGVLVMPLVGRFDAARLREFIDVLAREIEQLRARLVLFDITGLPLLDQEGAKTLIDAVGVANLLGAHCVLVGVRPEIAESIVALGVDLQKLHTAPTLEQALQDEIRRGVLDTQGYGIGRPGV